MFCFIEVKVDFFMLIGDEVSFDWWMFYCDYIVNWFFELVEKIGVNWVIEDFLVFINNIGSGGDFYNGG